MIARVFRRLLAEAGTDNLLGPAERLRFERMRLALRLGLLLGPLLLVFIFGEPAYGPAGAAAAITLISGAVVGFVVFRHPAFLLRFQLALRLIDVALIWLSVSSIQVFTGQPVYDEVYLLPVISAVGTHGKRGAYVVSAASALAVAASRVRLVLAGHAVEPIMIGDAIMHMGLFVLIGTMLDMLMRTAAGVVEKLRRSEQQEAQAALRESEKRYRLVSELTSDFAFAFRVDEYHGVTCEWMTEAMVRITGCTMDELADPRSWNRLIHPDDLPLTNAWWSALLSGESRAAEFRIRNRRGEMRLMRAHARPVAGASGRVESIFGAAQDITERKRWEEALEHQALHDALTDLPNRTLLQDRLGAAIAAAQREDGHLALLMIDLDRFKDINDNFGHYVGDLVLQQVGQRLRGILRASDTIARLGGDEFAIVLPTAHDEDATGIAAKLLGVLEAPFVVDGHQLAIGASIGLARFPLQAHDADSLLRHADTAMYAAKRSGGGVHVYAAPHELVA